MYENDTILTLREQQEPDADGNEFAYNKVRVVAPSPINHGSAMAGEWAGAAGQGVILEPLASFGGNVEYPLGRVQQLYDVESVPEPPAFPVAPQVRVQSQASLGESPEEKIARAMREHEVEKASAAPADPLASVDGRSTQRRGGRRRKAQQPAATVIATGAPVEDGEWTGTDDDPQDVTA